MEILSTSWTWLLSVLDSRGWIAVFVVILITALLSMLARRIYHKLKPKFKNSETIWDDALLHAAFRPVQAIIWIIGIALACNIVAPLARSNIFFQYVDSIREVAIILAFVWFCMRFIKYGERHYLSASRQKKKQVDLTTVQAVGKLLRVSVALTALLVIMQTLGFSISGILTIGGVGSLAIGFAAKDVLANFFGGLMLYLDRPFRVGDWIRSPDRNIEGTVEEIGWRLTRIRTFDKRPLYVPNSIFSTISVENPQRMQNRRIKTIVGVRYDDWKQVSAITQAIEKMLREHPEIDTSQSLFVNLIEFGPSSLNILIYTFTKTTQWIKFQGIQHEIFVKILEIIDNHQAECAFPTRTLHLPDGLQLEGINER